MAHPMPDIAVLLAQVIQFVGESEDFWRRIAAGTEEIVADDPASLERMLSAHDANGIILMRLSDLPSFTSLIAQRLKSVALPDETYVGEPFWTIMELRDEAGKKTEQQDGSYDVVVTVTIDGKPTTKAIRMIKGSDGWAVAD